MIIKRYSKPTSLALMLLILLLWDHSVRGQSVLDNPVSIATDSTTVGQLLDQLRTDHKFRLAYSEDYLNVQQRVLFATSKPTVREVLEAIGQATNTTYRMKDQQIIFRTKEDKATINGYIRDAASDENLIGANVLVRKPLVGTSSNAYGFYSLTLPVGDTVTLVYSYVGYQTRVVRMVVQQDTTLTVGLTDQALLDEVVVTAYTSEPIQKVNQMSTISVPVKQLKIMPALLGEADVLKSLQLLPGVQSGNEGTSGLYVRGGGPDQNLILLDGVPVYNASHLFGFFSVFNADAINSVQLIKGGFPARYGGRLSSVIDISMKEGNAHEWHGEGSVGLVGAKLTLEGPIVKDKTSFIVSGRRTWIDLLARPIVIAQTDGNESVGYFFYDVSAKVNHRFSSQDRLYLSAYSGDDRFRGYYRYGDDPRENGSLGEDKIGLGWGNVTSALRWNHVFTPKLFSNLTLTYSRYRFGMYNNYWNESQGDTGETIRDWGLIRYASSIQDWAAKLDLDYVPSPRHYVRLGASAIRHRFAPGALNVQEEDSLADVQLDTLLGNEVTYATEFMVYAEDDIEISRSLKVNIGGHWAGFRVNGTFYSSLQPRLSARYLLSPSLSLKASYAQTAQFVHLLTNSSIGLPTDLWVPTTERILPQRAQQVAVGAARTWRADYEMSIEGYYKTMRNLIEYREGASFIGTNNDWQSKVTAGNGRSYGAELLIQKKEGRTTGWLGYTLSWSNRQFDELNFGRRFSYKYDRRHDIGLTVAHQWKERVDVSLSWVYGTGNAITLPVARYAGVSPDQERGEFSYFSPRLYDYGERNGYRMRAYHRLDASVTFKKQTRWGERAWVVGVYNAYSRRNPFFVHLQDHTLIDQSIRFQEISLFPIIPSVSYRFTF